MCARSLVPVVLATLVATMLVAPAIAAPSLAAAQEPGAATSTGSTTPRTEETRSEVGGSSARITRGGDPTTAPVRSTRRGEDELPVNEEDDGRKADFIWL